MKAGEALEQLVGIIQEHLKDNPDVQITRNAKLVNRSGNTREIDVLVQGKFQGEDISIAFECKDYTRKITEQTIDAFATKIRELPQVDKGVIVTTIGYTKGAQKEAKSHKIGLYLIDDIPLDEIIYSSIFYGVRVLAEPLFNDLKARFIADEPNIDVEPEARIRYAGNDEEVNLMRVIFSAIYTLKVECKLVAKYMELGKRPYITMLKITPNRELYIADVRGKKYKIDYFEIPVKVGLIMEQCQIETRKKYSSITDENVVSVSEYKTTMSDTSWVVVESTNKERNSFFIKNNGCYYQPTIDISGQIKK